MLKSKMVPQQPLITLMAGRSEEEVAHNQMGGIDTGLWGFQLSNKNYEAVGEESLTPKSNTKKTALFLNEHWHGDHLHYEAGARLEKA